MEPQVTYTPLEVAIALSLYKYNVSPGERAEKLYDHFKGNCAEPENLVSYCFRGYVTDMALPTADIYVKHALEKYGREAKDRASYLEIENKLMKESHGG